MSYPFQVYCPANEILTGADFRTGSKIDGIYSIYCRSPNRISDSTLPDSKVPAPGGYVGGGGGTVYGYKCPLGSGVYYDVSNTKNGDLNSTTVVCRDFKTWKETGRFQFGNPDGSGPFVTTPAGVSGTTVYGTGFNGVSGGTSYGSGLKDIKMVGKDFSVNGFGSDAGKVSCCMGGIDPKLCPLGLTPQSQSCDVFMTGWCQSHPTDPRCSCVMSEMSCPNKFDKSCMAKVGYKTKDMVGTPCPSIMNCTQFLSLSPGAQNLATNVEQNCSSNTNTTPPSISAISSPVQGFSLFTLLGVLIFIFIIILAILYRRYAISQSERSLQQNPLRG